MAQKISVDLSDYLRRADVGKIRVSVRIQLGNDDILEGSGVEVDDLPADWNGLYAILIVVRKVVDVGLYLGVHIIFQHEILDAMGDG